MNVYINRQPVSGPWGGGNLWTIAAHEELSKKGHTLLPPQRISNSPDVILLAGIGSDGDNIGVEQAIMYKMMMTGQKDVKLILRVNENDARKGTKGVDDVLVKYSQYVDGTVFVSAWLQDYFVERGWKCDKQVVIHNGVDSEVFAPRPKLNNGKINLVMSHWSDNYLKGQDYAEWIDEFVGKHSSEFSFTFIGRTKAQFKNSTLVKPLHGKALGQELGKYDVCINASRFDPGPNSVIESVTCGLPTYVHVDGGGAVEFAGKDHAFSSFGEVECLLLTKQFQPNKQKFLPWEDCINTYETFINHVCGKFIV